MWCPEPLVLLAQQALGERIRRMTGSSSNLDAFWVPAGDPGLLGPDSVTWRVHADFTAMMVGGLSSLIVQALHPRALAAVWDHSDFRHKLRERLGRTAFFVAATTYGGTNMARGVIDRVNAIHANISGIDLEGRPYVANEPDLIRWVHLAEVSSFLGAYQHLSKVPLSPSECDGYVREMAQIGHLLGAVDLPDTWAQTQAALANHRPELRFDARAQEVLQVIENYPADLVDQPFLRLILRATFDVMPHWVMALIERRPACKLQVHFTRGALCLAAEPIQWALNQHGVAAVARRRVHGLATGV